MMVGQKSGVVYGLDPDDRRRNKVLAIAHRQRRRARRHRVWGCRATDKLVYFPLSDWAPDAKAGEGASMRSRITTGKNLWSTAAPPPSCIGKAGCSAAQNHRLLR